MKVFPRYGVKNSSPRGKERCDSATGAARWLQMQIRVFGSFSGLFPPLFDSTINVPKSARIPISPRQPRTGNSVELPVSYVKSIVEGIS